MVFSFLSEKKQDDALALVIDIGSASVGVALVRLSDKKSIFKKDSSPHILATNRETISFQETLSAAPFVVAMNKALARSLKDIQDKTKKLGAPANIYCTLSSPWFISKIRNINVVRNDIFKIDEKTLKAFLEEDFEELKEELKEEFPMKDMVVIEKKIIQMRLNGYEVTKFNGKKVSRVEISAIVGLSSGKVVESIEREIGHFFHTKSINFGSFPVAAYSTARDMFPDEKDFIFVDITGEATDISLINNDVMLKTVSFPMGKNSLVRKISAELKTPHEEASSLLNMYLKDALNDTIKTTVALIVKNGNNEWSVRFKKSVDMLAKDSKIPEVVYFTSDSDVSELFAGLMNSMKFEVSLKKKLEAHYINQFITSPFATFGNEVMRDPFLVIETLFASKINIQK